MRSAWQLIRRNPLASIGLVLIALFVSLALLAPWIAPQDPAHIDLPSRLQNASHAHWFGTDELGRDILSGFFSAARFPILVGGGVVAGSLFFGLFSGPVAGFFAGGIAPFFYILSIKRFFSFPET